jgi:drug/metabolite transporter (DMT)-like permease
MYLFPIYVVLLGPRLLGERITLRRGVGVALGVLGTVVMLQVWAIRDVGQVHVGDLFALASGVVYAGVMILGRRGSMREGIHPLALNAWSFTFGLLWLLLAGGGALLMGYGASTFMRVPGHITPRTLADFLGIATLGTAVPYGLMFAGLKRLEATTVSVLSLIEPISVLVMSMLFLHQTPDIWQMVGGAVILAAGALVVR